MKKYIDKDVLIVLSAVLGVYVFMAWGLPRLESYLFDPNFFYQIGRNVGVDSLRNNPSQSTSNQNNNQNNRPQLIQLEPNKDYRAIVKTSEGSFTIDLYETNAPENVANFITNISKYNNAEFVIERDYLLRIRSNTNLLYTIQDEINADYLLLDTIKVKDASYLSKLYNQNDPSTAPFEPNNLRKYADFSLKEFYTEVLGYKYLSNVSTQKAVKYVVYMVNTGPNTNKLDFFILMAGAAPELDGRYTPIGRVIEGFTTLDNINKSQNKKISIESITVQ